MRRDSPAEGDAFMSLTGLGRRAFHPTNFAQFALQAQLIERASGSDVKMPMRWCNM
jgi:hypothetical protein